MKNIEFFRKRKAEQDQELAKLAGNLNKLQQDREDIEKQITAAIDADRLSDVETLTAKGAEIDNRIRAAAKILERKKETTGMNVAEIAAASNDEMKKYQADISEAMKSAEKYRRMHYENLIKAGEILRAANAARAEYVAIAGAAIDDNAFTMVHGDLAEIIAYHDALFVNEIRPDGMFIINELYQ